MNSLIEKMKTMNSIEIDVNDSFVLKITHKGHVVSELCVSIQEFRYSLSNGSADCKLSVVNSNAIQEENVTITYHNFKK